MNDLTLTHEVLRDMFAMPQAVEVHRRLKAYRTGNRQIHSQLWVVDEVCLLETGERLVWTAPHRWRTEDGSKVFSGDIRDIAGDDPRLGMLG